LYSPKRASSFTPRKGACSATKTSRLRDVSLKETNVPQVWHIIQTRYFSVVFVFCWLFLLLPLAVAIAVSSSFLSLLLFLIYLSVYYYCCRKNVCVYVRGPSSPLPPSLPPSLLLGRGCGKAQARPLLTKRTSKKKRKEGVRKGRQRWRRVCEDRSPYPLFLFLTHFLPLFCFVPSASLRYFFSLWVRTTQSSPFWFFYSPFRSLVFPLICMYSSLFFPNCCCCFCLSFPTKLAKFFLPLPPSLHSCFPPSPYPLFM